MDTYAILLLMASFLVNHAQVHHKTHNHHGDHHPQRLRDHEPTWSAWSHWSPCSVTCSAGVKSRYRECVGVRAGSVVRLDPSDCQAHQREYVVCNAQECAENSTSVREFLCSKHDEEKVMEQNYEWVPFYGGNPCELTCMARGFSFLYNFGKVTDGSPCRHGNNQSVCVDGVCQTIGCDGLVGSEAVVDMCNVCGGLNKNCFKYTHTYSAETPPDDAFGYVEIAQIPAGVTRLKIREKSDNFLAIADSGGTFIINGNWMINWPGKYEVAGTTLYYERTKGNMETIHTDGPTKEDLHLNLLFRVENPGVDYEFWIPIEKLAEFQKVQDRRRVVKLAELAIRNTGYYIPPNKDSPYSPKDQKTQYSIIQNDPGTKLYDHPPEGISNSIKVNSDLFWNEDKLNSTSATKGNTLTALIAARAQTEVLPTRKPHRENRNKIINKYGDRWQQYAEGREQEGQKGSKKSKTTSAKTRKKKRGRKKTTLPDDCTKCKRVRASPEAFCESDFVIRVEVMDWATIGNITRHEMKLLTKYRDRISLFNQEYAWVPNRCRCPRLKTGRQYIMMGHLVASDVNRESRLQIDSTDYVRSFSQKQEQRMFKLTKKAKC